jgi:hypothetical protein
VTGIFFKRPFYVVDNPPYPELIVADLGQGQKLFYVLQSPPQKGLNIKINQNMFFPNPKKGISVICG